MSASRPTPRRARVGPQAGAVSVVVTALVGGGPVTGAVVATPAAAAIGVLDLGQAAALVVASVAAMARDRPPFARGYATRSLPGLAVGTAAGWAGAVMSVGRASVSEGVR